MPMHANFADWYRSASVTPKEGELQKRWAGVEVLAKDPTRDLIIGLARLFAVNPKSDASLPAGFFEAFRAQDETFSQRDNTHELRVLAGAVLRQIIEAEDEDSKSASLALVCGAFGPRASALPEPEHLKFAERYLVKSANSERQTAPLVSTVTKPMMTPARFAQIVPDALFTANAVVGMKDAFTAAFAELGTALSKTQKALDLVSFTVMVRQEELNMLWWLQNEFSVQTSTSFESVGKLAGTLVFSSELASLTTYVPGPASFNGVLIRALKKAGASGPADEATLSDIVNSTSRAWREAHTRMSFEGAELLCPVLFASSLSLSTEGGMEWFPVYKKVCDFPLNHSATLSEFSIQAYRERMLLRAILKA